MQRVEELWLRWMQDQPTKTITRLVELANAELEARRVAAALQAAERRAIADRLGTFPQHTATQDNSQIAPTRGEES